MILPSFVYCSTDRCDMRCEYCPTEGSGSYGENFEISVNPLPPDDVAWAAGVAGEFGLETFRLTGGEPLLDIERSVNILRGVLASQRYSNVRLNTNGSRLLQAIPALKTLPLTAIKVSLDTLDPVLFKKLTHSSRFNDVVRGIDAATAAGLPIEVNAVLTTETAPGMLALARFCQERSTGLKILDVVSYDSQPELYARRARIIQENLSADLEEAFGTPHTVQLSNNRGIFMKQYGTRPYVLFKDCSEGTTFTNYCVGCPKYPCEEGIHHLSLSTDGHLRPCRIRNNIFWDIRPLIARRDHDAYRHLLTQLIDTAYAGGTVAVSPEATTHAP
jgi:GTP 3',8-cyclase